MSDKLRVAVIGHTGRGNYGHALDTAWLSVPQTEIVAVADPDEAGLREAAARLKTDRTFSSYRTMLDEVRPDIVAICPRWVDQHAEMAVAAAEHGAHFLIEKPFCRSPAEADRILAACHRHKVHFKVAHPTRFSPLIQTVRQLIADGAIGDVLEFRARGKEDARGGTLDLWVLGSHVLDMVHAISGRPDWCQATVFQQGEPATAEDVVDGAEGLGPMAGDEVHAMFGWNGGGPVAWFDSRRNMAGKPSRYGLQIFGTRGVIEILEAPMPSVMILQDAGWSPGRSGANWTPVSTAGIGQPEPLQDPVYRQRHGMAIRALLAAVEQRGTEPDQDETAARDVVEMISAVAESHRRRQPVSLPLVQRENPYQLMLEPA